MSGGALSASHGVPDIGVEPLTHFCALIREISSVSGLPIMADADTGFGSVENCATTVHSYYNAGA